MSDRIEDLLTSAAREAPESEAIRSGGESWSYGRLHGRAADMAAELRARGICPGDRVAVLLPKSPEAVAAMYGILAAGAMYVPLDAMAPAAWTATVLKDADPVAIVTSRRRASGPTGERGARSSTARILVEDVPSAPAERDPASHEGAETGRPMPGAGDLAALYYTSGSGGRPKGVMHTHASLLASAVWFARNFGVTPADRLALHPPLHFKMSLEGILPAAIGRAASVLVTMEKGFRGRDLARLIRGQGLTIWKSVPAPVEALAASGEPAGSLPSLRHVACGGSGWRAEDVPRVRALAPDAELWQSYGSTESSTICLDRIEEPLAPGRPIPLGRPVDGVTVRILAQDGAAPPRGVAGELFVAGSKLMAGYWRDPERTADALVDLASAPGEGPWFRTGDLVRAREDGRLEFAGRSDQMIKVRGYRVELGQVEQALETHPRVREAAAIPVVDAGARTDIVAFVSTDVGDRPTETELRGFVAGRLPSYMVPARIQVVAALPLTSTGKTDRAALARAARESGALVD